MKVAIVILNWNGASLLKKYLPTLLKYTLADKDMSDASTLAAASSIDSSVYVVDNGSTDDSCALLESQFPQVQLIKLAENYGFAEGYNRGLAQLQDELETDYLLLLNSDVAVTPHFLEPLIEHLEANPDCAAVQPKICSDRDHSRFEHAGACGGFIDYLGYPYCRGRVFTAVEADHGQYDTPIQCDWASGACMLIRTTRFHEQGGFDTNFFAHMEEIDLCWRLTSAGYTIACIPQSVVYHWGGGSLPYGSSRKVYLNFRNNQLMLYKNLSQASYKRVMRWRWVLDYIAACFFLLKFQWKSFHAVFQARKDARYMRIHYTPKRKPSTLEQDKSTHKPFCVLFKKPRFQSKP